MKKEKNKTQSGLKTTVHLMYNSTDKEYKDLLKALYPKKRR